MESGNKEILLKIGEWFWLDQPDVLLEMVTAEAELYLVLPDQRRIFIHELPPGSVMVGLPPVASNIRLLALVTTAGLAAVSQWRERVDDTTVLDAVLRILLNGAQEYINPRIYETITANQAKQIPPDTNLKSKYDQAILWLYVCEGSLDLQGAREGSVYAGDFVAISKKVWLKSTKVATVQAYTTLELVSTYGQGKFLELFSLEQRWFLAMMIDLVNNESEREAAKMQSAQDLDESVITYAVNQLVKHDVKNLPPTVGRNEKNLSPVFAVTRLIAQNLGLPPLQQKLFGNEQSRQDSKELIQVAANSFGMVERKVRLKERWYEADHGELLVFIDEQPYAAIPQNNVSYRLLDPQRETTRLIDAAVAAEIADHGYSFYPQLPSEIDTLAKWFRWAVKFCWQRDLWLLFCACIIAGIIPIITPFITQTVFEDIIPTYDKKAHLIVVQVMFVAASVGALVNFVRGIAVLRIKNKMHVISESSLWLRLLGLPADFFRQYTTGDLAQRLQGVRQIYATLSAVVASGIFNGLFSFWNVLVMLYYSWKLTVAALLFWAVYVILTLFFARRLIRFQRQKTEMQGEVAGRALQLLTGISKFRVQAAENRAFSLWAEIFSKEWQWNRKARWQQNWLDFINTVMNLGLLILIYWLTIYWLDIGLKENVTFLSQPDFLGFNAALGGFGAALLGLLSSASAALGIVPLGERIEPILRAKPESDMNAGEAGELSGNLVVDYVDFRYSENKPLVLKNISFALQPGQFVAIVGRSGCGKSTLIRLLLGLEKAENGIIEYDGFALDKVSALSIRRQIGVVLQHGQLMAGSIADNIVGSSALTRDDAIAAAALAGLDEDIKAMPMGIDTVVSEGAGNISGGQRQRILIARAIVNRPRIVIFDEATSALDNRTQAIIAQTLQNLQATRIVVAHRLSTIKEADKILVMDHGEIVEVGNYEELLARQGEFSKLVQRQIV